MGSFRWVGCLAIVAGAVWTSGSRAEERCPRSGGAWVELNFSGMVLSPAEQENVLRELRVELGRRSLDVCLHSDMPPPSPAKAVVTLLANDLEVVSIVPSRIQDEGGFTGRTIRVGSIPPDARALAIAQAIDEVLRGERPAAEPLPPPVPPRDVAKEIALPAPERRSPFRFGAAVGPTIQVAPASSMNAATTAFVVGASLRAAATYAQFGGSLGLVLPTSNKLAFGSITIDQWRVPVDASARVRMSTGRLEGAADVGFVLAFLREEYAPAHRVHVQAEPGVRAGLTLSWGETIVPWMGASLEWVPAPYQLRFAPEGTIGQSSSLWLGLAVGMEARWP